MSSDAALPHDGRIRGVGIVGRDDCLRKLNEALDEVRAGTPVVALVHGGSGMGKTTPQRGEGGGAMQADLVDGQSSIFRVLAGM